MLPGRDDALVAEISQCDIFPHTLQALPGPPNPQARFRPQNRQPARLRTWVTAGSEAKLCGIGVLPYKVALKAESACDLGQPNLATRT